MQELGIAFADQRHQPQQHRHPARAGGRHQTVEHHPVEHRLGEDKTGAGGQLRLELAQLAAEVGNIGVERTAGQEAGDAAEPRAIQVVAVVEGSDQLEQTDRVEIEDVAGTTFPADGHRVAGHRQDVAEAEQVGAHQRRV